MEYFQFKLNTFICNSPYTSFIHFYVNNTQIKRDSYMSASLTAM